MPTGTKPPPLPGWLRAAVHYAIAGVGDAINVWWLRYDGTEAEAALDADLTTIVAGIHNAWLTTLAHELSTSLVLDHIKVVLFRASGELTQESPFSSSGAATGSVLPFNNCWVVNWTTHSYYRGGKPKSFLPGITSSQMGTAQHVDVSVASSLTGHAVSFIAALEALTTTHLTTAPAFIAPSFVSGGAYRTTALERRIYNAWVQTRLGSQRRRLGAPVD